MDEGQWRMAERSDEARLLIDADNHRIVQANTAAARQYGFPQEKLVGLPIEALWPDATPGLELGARGPTVSRHRKRNGAALDVSVQVQASAGRLSLRVSPVSARAFSLALMESEGRLIERIARGGDLRELLEDLVLSVERLSRGMLGSVLLTSEDGRHVRHGAAPHLPAEYWKRIDGLAIGPAAGSCGTAIYSAKQVIAADIARDRRWRDYRHLALPFGLRACWSTPILSPRRSVLGAFALYYREVRRPDEAEQRLVRVAADLAAIAIEREHVRRTPQAAVADGAPAHAGLSGRETEVLRLIAQGDAVKRIASKLHLTVSTVYTHRARLLEKLGARSNVELAKYAVAHRLLPS